MSCRRSRRCGSFRLQLQVPFERHRMSQCQRRAPLGVEIHVGDRVSRRYSSQAEVPPRITYEPAHSVETPVPTGSAHLAGFIEAEWLRCKRAQGELTASCLVAKQYCCMTAAQASSSTSTLTRATRYKHTTMVPDACSRRGTGSALKQFVPMTYPRLGAGLALGSATTEP